MCSDVMLSLVYNEEMRKIAEESYLPSRTRRTTTHLRWEPMDGICLTHENV